MKFSVKRGSPRGHLPFRGDDLEHGKKTGRHIKTVSRDSGGFEHFDQMMQQAYTNGHRPRPAFKARTRTSFPEDDDNDEDDSEEFYQPQGFHEPEDFPEPQDLDEPEDPPESQDSHDNQDFHEPQDFLDPDPQIPDDEEAAVPEAAEIQETHEPARQKRPKKARHITDYINEDDDDATSLRRSKRRHYPPLEYWRQERVVWGRRENGRSAVPVIKEIITIPKPDAEPLGAKKRKRGTRKPRSKSTPSSPPPVRVREEIRIIEVENPELGWDDATPSTGVIVDWTSKEEVERRVAYPARMVSPKPAQGYDYFFHKIFGDGDFVAAGHLVIPPGAEKPTKPTKDNTYIFYVVEGAIECKVHRTSFVLATGGSFMVPRGNQYYIKNISSRDVKLFFAQARKVPANEVATPSIIRPRASTVPRAQTPE